MKRSVLATFIIGAFFASGTASAEQLKHTVLGGYALILTLHLRTAFVS